MNWMRGNRRFYRQSSTTISSPPNRWIQNRSRTAGVSLPPSAMRCLIWKNWDLEQPHICRQVSDKAYRLADKLMYRSLTELEAEYIKDLYGTRSCSWSR